MRWLEESLPSLKVLWFCSPQRNGINRYGRPLKLTRGSVNEAGAGGSPRCRSSQSPAHSQQRSVHRTPVPCSRHRGNLEKTGGKRPLQLSAAASQRPLSTSQLGSKWPGSLPERSVRFTTLPGLDRETQNAKQNPK